MGEAEKENEKESEMAKARRLPALIDKERAVSKY